MAEQHGSPSRSAARKNITRVVVFLLLGAIVNFAVACALVLRSNLPETQSEELFEQDAIRLWELHFGRAYCNEGKHITGFYKTQLGISELVLLDQTDKERRAWQDACYGIGPHILMIQSGWPARSFKTWTRNSSRDDESHGAISLNDEYSMAFVKWPRQIPYSPIWPGFLINTMFYAAIVWLLFFAPFQLRRWRRIKCGLCPACTYPVGTSDICSECGKPVIARSV